MPPAPSARDLVLTPACLDDLIYWVRTDQRTTLRLLALVEAVRRDPFQGIGKPEPLKHDRAGTWSRRLTAEHRLVYQVLADRIVLQAARHHY
ncbi:MAG TPA: Txe/YoeB family addiction module toxin [Kofleriaceae bacterium]|nr:Txe/YoeB family addiction module toxin [Kofleriaceae bacterium]